METTRFTLTETIQEELLGFFDSHDIRLFSASLRRLFIDYLDYELRMAVPLYFDSFLYPFNELLDLLDTIALEKQAFAVAKKMHQPTAPKHETMQEKVIAFLQASLSPEKLFLLHHNLQEDGTAHFDVLAVIPESAQTNFSAYEQVISMANIEHAGISVSLHKAATLYRQLEEGHIYYSIVCNKHSLIYDKGPALPQAEKGALKMLAEKARAEFSLSHTKAESFLQGAANYYGENDKQMTAFMLQQAVELTLRGLIIALLGNCAKTHYIRELKKPLQRCAPELQHIFSNDEAEESRLLHLLEKAYLEARYTHQLVITDHDIQLLTEGAEDLHARAETVLMHKIEILQSTYDETVA